MTEQQLEIVVRGVARGRYAPEQATISLSVAVEGPDRQSVYTDAVGAHQPLIDTLKQLETDGAVSNWHSDTIRVYSYRPYNDGQRAAPVYNTQIAVGAEFVDFERLSDFIGAWSVADFITVGDVSWSVSEENRRTYEADVRREAVDDAVAKAQAYADAVGAGAVRPIQLADPNMLSEQRPAPVAYARMPAPAGADPGPSVEMRSEDIVIAIAVDARFVAD